MALLIDLLYVFSGLNVVLLIGLGYIWGRNYLQFRSKHTLGLFVFGVLLLLENLMALYLFAVQDDLTAWINDPGFVPMIAQQALTGLRMLEFAGIAFLSWVTWD